MNQKLSHPALSSPDILYLVFSHLCTFPSSAATLSLAAQVNQLWWDLLTPQIYRNPSIFFQSPPLSAQQHPHYSRRGAMMRYKLGMELLGRTLHQDSVGVNGKRRLRGLLKKLEVNAGRYMAEFQIKDEVVETLVGRCENVTEVRFLGLTNVILREYLTFLLPLSTTLQSLSLTSSPSDHPTLAHSSLTTSYLCSRLHHFTSLINLKLDHFTASMGVEWITPRYQLEELRFSGCTISQEDCWNILGGGAGAGGGGAGIREKSAAGDQVGEMRKHLKVLQVCDTMFFPDASSRISFDARGRRLMAIEEFIPMLDSHAGGLKALIMVGTSWDEKVLVAARKRLLEVTDDCMFYSGPIA